jgi:hypothetical protein
MLCCGAIALLVATAVGFQRWLRSCPRAVLVTIAVLLALTPVVAIATVSASGAGTETWILTMRSLCGGRFR